MTGGACPGSCNSRWREAQEAYKQALAFYDPLDKDQSRPEPPDMRPWEGAPVWCSACQSRISQRLGQLDDLACILQRFADGHRGAPDSPMVSGSTDAVSPSAAADAVDELARMLREWEHAWCDHVGVSYPRHEPDLASWITLAVSWLFARLAKILASPLAEDFGSEILSWHRELAGQAKAGTRKLRKPMRCPGCQQLTLTWVEGEEMVNCSDPSCQRTMGYSEYEVEVARRAGGAAA